MLSCLPSEGPHDRVYEEGASPADEIRDRPVLIFHRRSFRATEPSRNCIQSDDPMVAALICVVSVAALLQFFVAYCRLLLSSSGRIELSEQVRQLGRVNGNGVSADDFERFVELFRICPEHTADRARFRIVEAYYGVLETVGRASRAMLPNLAAWADGERRNCSYFAAVALDRRIALSRGLSLRHEIHYL